MPLRVAPRPRCSRCNLPLHFCLCDAIPQVQARTRVLLLQHVMEGAKKSSTGRVAALALVNSKLIIHGSPSGTSDLELLSEPGTWLLYPDRPVTPPDAPPPQRLK
ncbi:DTW domain-containing protein [Myxococcus sp. MxC21-1]|uniref:DTW domain-containing protein n=1 Tax=Myxococcus sp. MxC21-1 TaxID=3041439 RepID=UPI00292DD9FA|nr:DTW domain-containing protein [Myxococcus sp. MxC21-1]WNZ60145.1 DTW domain-containing protein [Myxococcus sp. MxC21-1]